MAESTFQLSGSPSALEDVQQQVQALLQTEGLRLHVISAFNVALGEWIENVIQYAYEDGANHSISVSVLIGPGDVTLRITDDGRPFNPCAYPTLDLSASQGAALAGRGIHLIRHLMDRVDYQRAGATNVVSLTKRCDFRDDL